MISIENFYYILYANLLKPLEFEIHYFSPFGSLDVNDLVASSGFDPHYPYMPFRKNIVYFYDQEPLNNIQLPTLCKYGSIKYGTLIANSEISEYITEFAKEHSFYNWYYFFHGFAALYWYSDYKYTPNVNRKFSKTFISLNRLTTRDRSYRLYLVSKMLEKDIVKHGSVSLNLTDENQVHWKQELLDPNSKLSKNAKITIYNNLRKVEGSLTVDTHSPKGDLSAHAGPIELDLNQSALWHVVSETVYYYDKLHLTEKIFKPIVSKRPFILVGATGNLSYLKKYGFKTFDKWIDESYDNEKDHTKRIDMITDELEKLCNLSPAELTNMYDEMKEILEYNFNHFYGKFREIITDELLTNFENCITQWNNGRPLDRRIAIENINLDSVREILLR